MRESVAIRDAYRRFADRLSAGDVDSFDDVVSRQANLIIGTAPGEWVEDRARMRFGFEAEGVRLEPRDARGYEEGTLGWVVDQPGFFFPDGSVMQTRVTFVFHNEEGSWRVVHAHFSVGVPDEEVVELQRRWGNEDA
jgi:hypothetical protein